MGAPDEWPSRRDLANTRQAGVGLPSKQNPAYRPAGNFIQFTAAKTYPIYKNQTAYTPHV